MIPLLLLSLTAANPAPACAPEALRPVIAAAAKAFAANDTAAAAAALAPAADCPVTTGQSYAVQVMRADVGVRQADWAAAQRVLAGLGLHPENGISALAGMLRLRADQGLGDAAAFTRDRDALLAADDRRLRGIGRYVESFRVPAGRIDAYAAPLDQGGFHRVLEFIATPDDPAAYPVTIQLTDDRTAAQLVATTQPAGAPGGAAATRHIWFIDLYTCVGHSTLAPPAKPVGLDVPPYPEIRARVVATLADPALLQAAPPPPTGCSTGRWLLPGLGAVASAATP